MVATISVVQLEKPIKKALAALPWMIDGARPDVSSIQGPIS